VRKPNYGLSVLSGKPQDPENPQGRVKFILSNGNKIRYAGSSGYFYQGNKEPGRYFLKYRELLQLIVDNYKG
jgi:hypothetical protein